MHQEKMKDKKKKKKSKKHRDSDSSDEEDEAKKKEKLKKVRGMFLPHKLVSSYSDVSVLYKAYCKIKYCLSVQALSAEEQRLKQVAEIMQLDERKRPYSSLKEVREPTEEEMEAFRMKRCRADDPMASFLGQWMKT